MTEYDPQALQIILEESLVEIRSGQETFDSILDKYPDIAEDLRPGLEAALWLSAQRPSLDPRPGFIPASRARLMAEISQNNPGAVASGRSSIFAPLVELFQRRYALQFAFLFIILIGFVLTGTIFVAAANNSIPGDPLYTTKLNIEQIRLVFTPTGAGQARLNIEFADRRSQELQQLALQGRYGYIPQTNARFNTHVEHAIISLGQVAETRPEVAQAMTLDLQEIVEKQVVLLAVMAETAPPEARTSLLDALQVTVAYATSINELLQLIIGAPTATITTRPPQATSTLLPSVTPSPSLPATGTSGPSATPTPTVTDVRLPSQPTPTPTTEDQGEPSDPTPTDTDVPPPGTDPTFTPTAPVEPTVTDTPVAPTDYPDPTDITNPTDTVQPPDPTDIPPPPNPTDPPDPTDIPGFGDEDPPTSTPKPSKTPKPTKTPKP